MTWASSWSRRCSAVSSSRSPRPGAGRAPALSLALPTRAPAASAALHHIEANGAASARRRFGAGERQDDRGVATRRSRGALAVARGEGVRIELAVFLQWIEEALESVDEFH